MADGVVARPGATRMVGAFGAGFVSGRAKPSKCSATRGMRVIGDRGMALVVSHPIKAPFGRKA
jgi:hypothetical protein